MARKARYRWQGWHQLAPRSEVDERHGEPRFKREPMTEKQAVFLSKLCEQAGVPFDPSWSKSRASREIVRLKKLARRYEIRER